jgi:hypothetical protein
MTDPDTFTDVLLVQAPEPTLTYRSALAVYEESLTRGQFVARGWNGAGFINFYDGRLAPTEFPAPQAFWLELDGQLLASDWEWAGLDKLPTERPGGLHAVVTLRHAVRPVTVRVHTLLDGSPVLARWLEVTNTGERPAALAAAYLERRLQKVARWRSHLGERARRSIRWAISPTPTGATRATSNGSTALGGLPRGRALSPRPPSPPDVRVAQQRHRRALDRPARLVGGYSFEFDLDADLGTLDQAARLSFRAGPDAPAPQRIIAPGRDGLDP